MKFICEECEKPCILEVGDCYNLTADVLQCVCKNNCYCKWEEFKEEPTTTSSQSATNCNRLPKLTAEVFDRPDCPKWAKYAAVDKYRNAMWYEEEPKVVGSVFWNSHSGQIQEIPSKFDASDWTNSLVERPASKLPDWCKVGEWVYLCNGTYSRIVSINDCHVNLENGISVGKNSIHEEMVSARLRPYNAEEMKALVGKIVCDADGNNELITGWSVDMKKVRFNSIYYSAQRLLDEKLTIDGSLCRVLEHLENGEWVK